MNKAAAIVNEDATPFLPDGVYLGLSEEDYFAQDALGSTDIRKLIADPVRWWWQSRYNPLREKTGEKSREMIIGSAWHCLALEGVEAFQSRYRKAPDKREHPGLLVTTSDIKGRIVELGHKPDGKVKEDFIAQLVRIDGEAPIWERIMAAAERDPRQELSAQDYDEVLWAAHGLLQNDDWRALHESGYPEVSVFWTEGAGNDAVRRRARFDWLTHRGVADLKSIGIADGDPRYAVVRSIDNKRYDVQAADHQRALRAARDYLSGLEPALKRALACPRNYHWFFWDKRAGPSIHSVHATIGGEVWDAIDMEITRATNDFRRFRAEFGMDCVWSEARDPNFYEPGASWGMRANAEWA